MKTTLIVRLTTAAIAFAAAYSAVITSWNFENPPDPIAVNNNPAPTTGVGMASSIGMDVYPTPNVGVTTDDVTKGATGARHRQQRRISVRFGVSALRLLPAAAPPTDGQAWRRSALKEPYSLRAPSASLVRSPVSYDWYATTQGEADQQLQYTNDGANWNNVPIVLNASDTGLLLLNNSVSPSTVNGWYVAIQGGGQDWFPGLMATINDPAAAGNPNFGIRMVNASTGRTTSAPRELP